MHTSLVGIHAVEFTAHLSRPIYADNDSLPTMYYEKNVAIP